MDAESMSETVETCCRCGSPLAHEPVLILVQSGPLHSAHPVINLCPACANSMTRWFARRHHAQQPEPAAHPIERPAGTSHRHRHHDHHQLRQRRRWRRRRREVDPQGRRDRLRVSHVHHSHACGISGLEVIITRLLSSGWRFPILRGAQSGAGAAGDRRPK